MRSCGNCGEEIPPETEHFRAEGETVYCMDCVEQLPYTATAYYLAGEYMGDDQQDTERIQFVESYDDEYEEGEESK